MKRWKILPEEEGLSLLLFLKAKLNLSNRNLKSILESNCCTVNGRVERFGSSYIVASDIVLIDMPETMASATFPSSSAVSILYEDHNYVCIDKPAGIASDDSILIKGREKLLLVHRLDKGTSGVLAFAKDQNSCEALEQLFRTRKVKKHYLAIVMGTPDKDYGRVDNFLAKIKSYQGQSIWGAVPENLHGSLRAVTDWHVLKRGKGCALMECFPMTGRTHQIRVHMSGMGCPVVGDVQYGVKKIFYPSKRPLLHAAELSFEHPKTEKQILVKAPLPEDFQRALVALGLGK